MTDIAKSNLTSLNEDDRVKKILQLTFNQLVGDATAVIVDVNDFLSNNIDLEALVLELKQQAGTESNSQPTTQPTF